MFNEKGIDEKKLSMTIPTVLGTQHPDNCFPVPFGDSPYVPFEDEATEVYYNFANLDITEMMIDTEGKKGDLIPFCNVVEKDPDFFKKNHVGEKFRITPRIPNPDKSRDDPVFYQSLGIFINSLLVQIHRIGIKDRQAITEFIVPNTVNGIVIPGLEVDIQRNYDSFCERYKRYGDRTGLLYKEPFSVQGIPLIEDVENLMNQKTIWDEIIDQRKKLTGRDTYVQRSFIARSDPALKAGMVPAMLAAAISIWSGVEYEKEKGIFIPQILGAGSSPFRGGLNPYTLDVFKRTYPGISTVTLQSAFRYDWPRPIVVRAISQLKEILKESWLSRNSITSFDSEEIEESKKIIRLFKKTYEESVEELAQMAFEVAEFVPGNRDRYKFQGIDGYGREVAGRRAPRAIKFCAAFYSLGFSPGLLGFRAYYELSDDQRNFLNRTLPTLKTWIAQDAEFLNKCNALTMDCKLFLQDIEAAEQYNGGEFDFNRPHAEITDSIFHSYEREDVSKCVIEAARERRFLG